MTLNQKSVVRKKGKTNFPLILVLTIIVVWGLVVLYSVSGPAGYATESRSTVFYLKKQIGYTIVGFVGLIILNFLPVGFFKKFPIWLTALASCPAIILLTRMIGKDINGAKRWIGFGGTTFQTSEYVKVAIVIGLAGYWNYIQYLKESGKFPKKATPRKQLLCNAFWEFILPVGVAALTDVLILAQPHLSCAIIVAFVVFMCALTAGVNWKSWVIGGGILILFAIVLIGVVFIASPAKVGGYIQSNFAHVFKRAEIYSATHDEDSEVVLSEDDTRQVTNAHNALGSGGLWGRGIGNSRAKYSYVSEAQNDYIFSIFVEETGFFGGTMLILLYMSIIVMCVLVIVKTDSSFSRVIAVGCTSLIMIEFLLNLAVELQVIPSTGVTLPFVSYGGTAQVFLLLAYGMILGVSKSGVVIPEKKVSSDEV